MSVEYNKVIKRRWYLNSNNSIHVKTNININIPPKKSLHHNICPLDPKCHRLLHGCVVRRSDVIEPAWQKSNGNIEGEKMSTQRVPHQSNDSELPSTQNSSVDSLIKCPVGVNYFHRRLEDSHKTEKVQQQWKVKMIISLVADCLNTHAVVFHDMAIRWSHGWWMLLSLIAKR